MTPTISDEERQTYLLQQVARLHVESRQQRMRRERARQRRKARIRRHRMIAATALLIFGFGLYGLVGLLSPSQGTTPKHLIAPVEVATVVGPNLRVAGSLGAIGWPASGEAAVGLLGAGVVATSPRQRVVPIASMTKMMTALVILRDHPLRLGQQGPLLTMTAADAREWVTDDQNDDAVVPVQRGQHLSEYQLLEALLIPSGDNVADLLARWDATTVAKFVVKMNVYARSLGLNQTTYADASGVNPRSRSTPADQVAVVGTLMGNPVLRKIVGQPSIPFPVAGTLTNVNPVLDSDGIIGVKSGFTSEAQGCLAVASVRSVGTKRVMEIAVTTGNPNGLYGAGAADQRLLDQLQPSLVTVTPTTNHVSLANARLLGTTSPVPWRIVGREPTLVGWKGLHISSHVVLRSDQRSHTPSVSATLVYTSPTGVLGSIQLSDPSAVTS